MLARRTPWLVGLALAASCDRGEPDPRPPEPPSPAWARLAVEVEAVMDPAVDPCTDFYEYACGGWIAATPLPADRPRYGRAFGQLVERNEAIVRAILDEALAAPSPSPQTLPLRTFHGACMAADAGPPSQATTALKPYLAPIDALADARGLMALLGSLHTRVWSGDASALFTARIEPDPKRPDTYILTLAPGGLGLPDRDYYLADDPASVELRRRYQDHVATMLGFLGEAPAEARTHAAAIVAFERRLAALHRPRATLRDPESIYNRIGEAGLRKIAALDWPAYFDRLAVGPVGLDLNVTAPEYFAGLAPALATLDPPTLRAYLRWHLLHATAAHLGAAEANADFELTAALTGARALPPRWQRCVTLASEGGLGDLVGPLFVARTLGPDRQKLAVELVEAIEAAFADNLATLPWMDSLTRRRSRDKLQALTNKIGQPSRYRDAADFRLDPSGSHLDHVLTLRALAARRHAGELGGRVDRDEWEMSPSTVNAYYSPPFNEIVFPAAILQAPYFGVDSPMAMNFGGLGMVIGHELVHGFDDEGRRYDGNGVLREWWEPESLARFGERAACLERAYSRIEVLPGVPLDGRLTLGENIADLGGIRTAYAAHRSWIAARGDEPRLVAELSGDQLFFVAFAQAWCTVSSPEALRLDATVDPHAPPRQRVNVPLAHDPDFWGAFRCGPGTPMHAAEVCEVW